MFPMKMVTFFAIFLIFVVPVIGVQRQDVQGSRDHRLVPRMPYFSITGYREYEFDRESFRTGNRTTEVEGRKYIIDYELQPDSTSPGKPGILLHYQNHFKKDGADHPFQGPYYDVFKIIRGDTETWVKVDPGVYDGKRYTLTIVEKGTMPQKISKGDIQASNENDVEDSSDHPLAPRMSNFHISAYRRNESGSESFKTENGNVDVEGRRFVIDYRLLPESIPPGKAQILQYYRNALDAAGAEQLLQGPYYDVFKIVRGNAETWIKVDPGVYDGKRYTLTIVEKEGVSEMRQIRSRSRSVIKTDALQMTGFRGNGRALRTETLEMTGLPEGRMVRTDALQMTGFRGKGRTVQTETLQMTGLPEGRMVRTDRLEMTGLND